MTLEQEHEEKWTDAFYRAKINGVWCEVKKGDNGRVVYVPMNPQPETVDKI